MPLHSIVAEKTLLVIAGPTAVGKTAVALGVAEQLETSIISADSRQCYREMRIGTAVPSAEDLARVPHYFIGSHSVHNPVTAAGFEALALAWLAEIFETRDAAVVCGGTGLYIRALCEGLDEMPPVPKETTDAVQAAYNAGGMPWLQAAVEAEDPHFFAHGERENPARMTRALSFVRATGQSILHYRSGAKKARPFRIVKIGLEVPRESLYARINARVDSMMRAGLLKEARSLYSLRHLPPLQTVGYAELFEHFDGKISLAGAVEKIKQHTRNYAKRQMTWFKKDAEVRWMDAEESATRAFILGAVSAAANA